MSPEIPAFETLAIVGVGLLGGSVAKAAKARGVVRQVIGIGRNESRLQAAADAGVIDRWTTAPADLSSDCGLVVIATPVDRIAVDALRIAGCVAPGTIVTDVGSVKSSICDTLTGAFPDGVHFVGSHPIAGSEQAGFEAAKSDLFDGNVTVTTPTDSTSEETLNRVEEFWRALGSSVLRMSPTDHDQVLARTSHLPHVGAAAIAACLESSDYELAGRGFRDTTRIAAGDPDLWVSILLSNRDAVLAGLQTLKKQIANFESSLVDDNPLALKQLLTEAKESRDALTKAKRSD